MQVTRERLIQWEDPIATAAALRTYSGIDGLRAIMTGELPPPPIGVLMRFRLVEAEVGRVVFEGDPGEDHYNPGGTVHGGFALTLFDSALGCAIQSTLPVGVGSTTTDTQVRFIRGISKDTGPVRCEATAIHVGRTTGVAEAKLYDAQRRVLGIGTTACAVLRPKSA